MAFNLKNKLTSSGLSRRSSSPLTNINDPIVTLVGDEVPVKNDGDGYTYGEAVIDGDDLNNTTTQVRERTVKGQEVEKKLLPEDFVGGINNPEYQNKLKKLNEALAAGAGEKYEDKVIKEQKIDKTSTAVKDYTDNFTEFNETFENNRPVFGNRYHEINWNNLANNLKNDENKKHGIYPFPKGAMNKIGGELKKRYDKDPKAFEGTLREFYPHAFKASEEATSETSNREVNSSNSQTNTQEGEWEKVND